MTSFRLAGVFLWQISDENLHHVREVLEEVFGTENFVVTHLVEEERGTEGFNA